MLPSQAPHIVLTTSQSTNSNQDIFWELVFSLPTTRLTSVLTWSINTLLILLAADFVLTPVFDSATDVTFTRIGAVYPDAVKVAVRYPLFEAGATEHHVRVQWRPVTAAADDRWKDGPILHLSPESDWTNTTKLTKLWPSTEYECASFPLSPADANTLTTPSRHLGRCREETLAVSKHPNPLPHLPGLATCDGLPLPFRRVFLSQTQLPLCALPKQENQGL
jgi:hypothetical protein